MRILYILLPFVMAGSAVAGGLQPAGAGEQAPAAEAASATAQTAAAKPAAASPDTTFDKKRFQTEVVEHPELPNLHEVHPYLYRSGAPDEKGMEEAKAKGIKTIIDLRNPGEIAKKGDEAAWAKKLGMKYISMPMGPKPPTRKQVGMFMDTVKDAEQHPDKGAVLVHCSHGSDRTGCLVGIWRVKQDGWTYDKAYHEMRKYWFTPKFTGLSGAVKEYSQQSPKH